MQHKQFEDLLTLLLKQATLAEALAELKNSSTSAIAEVAMALTGQFASAEVNGQLQIFHVTACQDANGEEQEFVEHIMNEGEDIIKFIAWFFESQFDYSQKEIYQMAGKTYQQPKRS